MEFPPSFPEEFQFTPVSPKTFKYFNEKSFYTVLYNKSSSQREYITQIELSIGDSGSLLQISIIIRIA